jgi:hypothetical protein
MAGRFSRRTVIAAIEVMDQRFSQAQLTRYLLKLGPHFVRWVGDEKISVTRRLNNLIGVVDQNPERRLDDDEMLQDHLVETATALVPNPTPAAAWLSAPATQPEYVRSFQRALALDGFTISDGTVRRALPADIGLPAAKDDITRLLDKHGLHTPKGHLEQALDAHAEGKWASANAQIRSFLDGLLDEIAERLDPSAVGLGSGQPRRAKLAACGFLSRALNEWDDNGGGFINGLARRLHPQGSHPGLSDDEDSTFRLHIVLITGRLLLTRFDAAVAS